MRLGRELHVFPSRELPSLGSGPFTIPKSGNAVADPDISGAKDSYFQPLSWRPFLHRHYGRGTTFGYSEGAACGQPAAVDVLQTLTKLLK